MPLILGWFGDVLANIEVEHGALALFIAIAAAVVGALVQTRHAQQQRVITEIHLKVNGQLTRVTAALEKALAMLPEEKALAALDASPLLTPDVPEG